MGDFYELFHGDAEEGSRILGLTLTSRNNGAAARVPLAGIPVKALDDYLARLVRGGQRVAICEQVEDRRGQGDRPAGGGGDGHPRHGPPRLYPAAKKNTYLAAVAQGAEGWGLATLDLSTGEFGTQVRIPGTSATMARVEPSELLLPRSLPDDLEARPAHPPPVRPARSETSGSSTWSWPGRRWSGPTGSSPWRDSGSSRREGRLLGPPAPSWPT